MKSEQLVLDVLKRQNREMAIKMQIYRVENQELRVKNEELNQWVGNLSEVFSTLSASWESITILEETLLNLMKKKTDVRDRTLLRKYQLHFKTFADIINNLSQKIQNKGHSDQATENAKQQLRSFVKNYELMFKQMLESYFKFNQEYSQYLNGLQNREDIQQQFRSIAVKSVENAQKIKEFQAYVEMLKNNFTVFEDYNSNKLLEGVVKKKEEEIQALSERNNILERRIKILFDYNPSSVEFQLNCKQDEFQCKCGGTQLSYLQKKWQQKTTNTGQANSTNQTDQPHNPTTPTPKTIQNQAYQQKLAIIQEQKQNLITRNTLLLEKMTKMNSQYKLTQDMVLKSNVYAVLKEQCQNLLDYTSELVLKIRKQQEFISGIERAREEELKELRRKFQKNRNIYEDKNFNNAGHHHFQNPLQLFKSQISNLIRSFTTSFEELGKKHLKSEQLLKVFKDKIDQLRKSNEELNRKVADLQARQHSKTEGLQFKYEKYKELQTNVQALLQRDLSKLLPLWEEFIIHVKSRDKKIANLESMGRKKDKELAQKIQIQELMRADASQIQRIYKDNKEKLSKYEEFVKKVQDQLHRLATQNYKIHSQFEQEKSLLNMRLKAETDARNRLQQKILMISKIQQQFTQIRNNQSQTQKDCQQYLTQTTVTLQKTHQSLSQNQLQIKSLSQQLNQSHRQLQKLQTQKQTLKSQTRQLKNRLDNLNSSTQNQLLRMELQQYKGKIMCSCGSDRDREVVLKTCPHLFCRRCIDDTTINRNRKCPLCGIRFTKTDVHEIKWS